MSSERPKRVEGLISQQDKSDPTPEFFITPSGYGTRWKTPEKDQSDGSHSCLDSSRREIILTNGH